MSSSGKSTRTRGDQEHYATRSQKKTTGSKRGAASGNSVPKSPSRRQASYNQSYPSTGTEPPPGYPAGQASGGSSGYTPAQIPVSVAPSTGQFRSGHIEVDTLYAAANQSGQNLVVNSMNAPNNSTMQCGCENIDCPFCNLMMSVQMKGAGGF